MPNDLKKLRRLMSVANMLKKSPVAVLRGNQPTASQALRYAWWFEDFRAKLANGVYRFSYFKMDGSIREAVGTLQPSRIPEEQKPKCQNEEMRKCENYISFPYYDLGVCAWRSFRQDNFIGFVEKMD